MCKKTKNCLSYGKMLRISNKMWKSLENVESTENMAKYSNYLNTKNVEKEFENI